MKKSIIKKRLKQNRKAIFENYKWFSKFSPVERLRIAKRAAKFLKILRDAK